MPRHNVSMKFKTISRGDVPSGRNGKHKKLVSAILADLEQLKYGAALKIPLDALGDSKENVRSALNRAIHKIGRNVSTAADEQYFYVWNVKEE